jgi:hypothetical protein
MPRLFDEVQALYGDQMRALSGGLVYEYSQEEANYGLVTINQDDQSVSLLADYDNLQDQFNKLDVSALQSTNPASTSIQAPECATSLITAQDFSKNFTIPAVCPGCQDLIDNGIENPQNGALVDVTDTQVKQKVFGSNGQQIQDGLTLNVAEDDGSNTPNGDNTSPSGTPSSSGGSNPTQTGAQPSQTTTGDAGQLAPRTLLGAALLCVIAILL